MALLNEIRLSGTVQTEGMELHFLRLRSGVLHKIGLADPMIAFLKAFAQTFFDHLKRNGM